MQKDYLTTKKPFHALLLFSVPIIIGNFFQQIYTMADSAIVGRFVGEKALAAVGASYALTNIFIMIAIGGGIGASVVVSQYFGAKQFEKMKKAIYTSFLSFLLISILLGSFGLLFSEKIMLALHTPKDVLEMSVQYLNIYFLGLPFLFMYNVLSATFNALGESKVPLYFLIFSSLFNIILDLFLVTTVHLGVVGVAWATLIAQGISASLSYFVFMKRLNKYTTKQIAIFDQHELSIMTKIALPSILQQSTVSIGMMLVQSVVNGFGSEALAGFSAAMRVESLCIVPMLGIGNAISSYTAQNIGANKEKRVIDGFHIANYMVIFCGLFIFILLARFHHPIVELFLSENGTKTAFQTGENYLLFMSFFFSLIGFKMVVDSILRGAGDMKVFTIANLVNLFIRVFIAIVFAPKYGIQMIWYAVPIGWLANWIISYWEYRRNKWKHALLPSS